LSPGDIAAPLRRIFRRHRDVTLMLGDVQRVDVESRTVTLDGGDTVGYDVLVLATGATHAYFGHDEWRRAAPGLKTLDDALEIRRRVLLAFERAEREQDALERQALLTFVVVGAGATGVEMAGALAGIAKQALVGEYRHIEPESARIILVEGGSYVLPAFPPDLRRAALADLQQLGVEVRTDTKVTHRAGRVLVNPDLTVPGHANVFVVGDLAALSVNGRPLPGLAAVAQQQGDHAAKNIQRVWAGKPLRPFRYRDRGSLATIGRWRAVAEIGDWHFDGALAWFVWLAIHLRKLVGFRNRVSVLVQWLWSLTTLDRSVRLITRDDLVWDRDTPNDPPRFPERRGTLRPAPLGAARR
jgi:NADH dehydrogenase